MPKRKMIIAGMTGIVAAGLIGGGAVAMAAPASTPTAVMKACVNNKDGSMRLVASSASTCPTGQRLVTWNVQGVAGAKGATGVNGKDGANGKDGVNGKDGANGQNGQNGQNGHDGADRISTGKGAPSQLIIDAAAKGDIYVDLDTSMLSVFDGTKFGTPVSLKGMQGDKGATGATGATGRNGTNGANGVNGTNGTNGTNGVNGVNGVNGTRIFDGAGPASADVLGIAADGDLYFDTTAVSLAVFDKEAGAFGTAVVLKGEKGDKGDTGATGAAGQDGAAGTAGQNGAAGTAGQDGAAGAVGPAGPAGAPGAPGENGKSVSVVREVKDAAAVTEDTTSLTLTCSAGTAIGAGYANVATGTLTGSNAGAQANQWVLTFSGATDLDKATGTVLCAVTA